MDWSFLLDIIKGTTIIAGFIGSLTAIIEFFFSPIRKVLKAKKERKEREKRIEDSLGKLDSHLKESRHEEEADTKWKGDVEETLKNINKILENHDDAILASKNERRVLWRAQRATLDGLKQLHTNGLVSQSIQEMDNFTDDNMRK